jgi:hypothetical protein
VAARGPARSPRLGDPMSLCVRVKHVRRWGLGRVPLAAGVPRWREPELATVGQRDRRLSCAVGLDTRRGTSPMHRVIGGWGHLRFRSVHPETRPSARGSLRHALTGSIACLGSGAGSGRPRVLDAVAAVAAHDNPVLERTRGAVMIHAAPVDLAPADSTLRRLRPGGAHHRVSGPRESRPGLPSMTISLRPGMRHGVRRGVDRRWSPGTNVTPNRNGPGHPQGRPGPIRAGRRPSRERRTLRRRPRARAPRR